MVLTQDRPYLEDNKEIVCTLMYTNLVTLLKNFSIKTYLKCRCEVISLDCLCLSVF